MDFDFDWNYVTRQKVFTNVVILANAKIEEILSDYELFTLEQKLHMIEGVMMMVQKIQESLGGEKHDADT